MIRPRLSNLSPLRRALAGVLFALASSLGVAALLHAQWTESQRGPQPRSVDMVICLDVSRSMLAQDLQPTRLQSAQRAIRKLAQVAKSDRLALVSFAGEARLSIPLTHDGVAFADLVDLEGPASVRRGGTDLGSALATALTALHGRSGEKEVVFLLTDGEDLQQTGLQMAAQFRQQGISLHCIGYGSEMGSKIAVQTQDGLAFLRNADGIEVISAMDGSGLQSIAAATGGQFQVATSSSDELVELYRKHVLPMVLGASPGSARASTGQLSWWLMMAALLIWILALGMPQRRSS